jgi:GR25 family glycosyltransferase involved in LPS biosynthesis
MSSLLFKRTAKQSPKRSAKRSTKRTGKQSPKQSPKRSTKRTAKRNVKKSPGIDINSVFDKVYIISLEDKHENFLKVSNQLSRLHINHSKFPAIDGRCPKNTPETQQCIENKTKQFEKDYKVVINKKLPLSAASLTIGTILILREMIEKGWNNILILEDDVVLDKKFIELFQQGMSEIKKQNFKWDMLYLGCGGECGIKGVSWDKTKTNKYKSTWEYDKSSPMELYVRHPYDLRIPCEDKKCKAFSKHITHANKAGGTWGYAYSIDGAKKFLKTLYSKNKGATKVDDHIDQLLMKTHQAHGLSVLAFDEPIIWHEFGIAQREKFSTIDW